jgi:hypothetical protein
MTVRDNIENLFEWMKENPAESMLILNGAWLLRGFLFKASATLMKKTISYMIEHPARSALIAGTAYAAYVSRRELIKDFVGIAYDDPAIAKPEAQEMLKKVYEYTNVDPSKEPTLMERQVPKWLESIVADPAQALLNPTVTKWYKEGKFSLGWDAAGGVMLFCADLTAPVLLAKLTWHNLSGAIKSIYLPNEDEGSLTALAIGGTEIIITGFMAKQVYKSYGQLIEISAHSGSVFKKILKSGIPLTKEWRFIWRSALTSGPVLTYLKGSYSKNVGVIESSLIQIEDAVNKGDLNKAKSLAKKITKTDIFEDVTLLRKNLNVSSFTLDYFTRLDEIKQKLEALENAADTGKVSDMRAYLAEAKKEVGPLRTWLSNTVTMCELLIKGKWQEAMDIMKVKAPAETIMPKQKYKTPDTIEGKSNTELLNRHTTLKKEISTLEKDIAGLPEGEAKLQKLAALKKARAEFHQIDGFINHAGYKNISTEAARIEKLTGPEKAKAVQELAERMTNTEKGFNARIAQEIEKITKMTDKKAQAAAAAEALQKEIDAFSDTKLSSLKKLHTLYYSVVKTGSAPKELRAAIAKAVDNASDSFSTRVIKGAKGRAKLVALMTVVMFATEHVINKDEGQDVIDEIKSFGPEFWQLLIDVLPLSGTFSNFYSACSGREIVTDRDVSSGKDRALNVVWGTVSLAGDIITALTIIPSAGASIGGAAAARLTAIVAKGGRMAPIAAKLLKMFPRIAKAAEECGGWRNFAKRLKAPTKVTKTLRKIEVVGMTTGTLMLAGGAVNAIYGCKAGEDTEIPNFGPEIAGESTDEPPVIEVAPETAKAA